MVQNPFLGFAKSKCLFFRGTEDGSHFGSRFGSTIGFFSQRLHCRMREQLCQIAHPDPVT